MTYQYGQGFEKDLKSLVDLINKSDTFDFDSTFLDNEVNKIIKYNKTKIVFTNNDAQTLDEFFSLNEFVSWFNKWDQSYRIEIKKVNN